MNVQNIFGVFSIACSSWRGDRVVAPLYQFHDVLVTVSGSVQILCDTIRYICDPTRKFMDTETYIHNHTHTTHTPTRVH